MNKNEMKKTINQEFGFAINKITLLEASTNRFGSLDYIMFEVCGIEYQIRKFAGKDWTLNIYNDHGRMDICA